jgi:hypothetical protein
MNAQMKKKRMIRTVLALFILAADLFGLAAAFGILESSFRLDRLETFTVIAALNVLVYYLYVLRSLRHRGALSDIDGWRFGVLSASTFMALYTWIFLQPVYTAAGAADQLAMKILDGLVPFLVFLDWALGEKRHFRKRFIPIGMFIPVVYLIVALSAGASGHGLGTDGKNWPYPMLNADQLGWKLVMESVILLVVLLWLYCYVLVKADRRLGRKKTTQRRYR